MVTTLDFSKMAVSMRAEFLHRQRAARGEATARRLSDKLRSYHLMRGESVTLKAVPQDRFYLIEGDVRVVGDDGRVCHLWQGSNIRDPIHIEEPQQLTFEALNESLFCRIPPGLAQPPEPATAPAKVTPLPPFFQAVSRLTQPEIFRQLPIGYVEEAYQRMHHRKVGAGEVIITQHDPAGDFYVIAAGSAEVWRKEEPYDSEPRCVARLGMGDHFGEEALILDGTRNATVRMATDGLLLVLKGDDFRELVHLPLHAEISAEEAKRLLDRGERKLIDLRYVEEWEVSHIPGSKLLPLYQLRERISELDPQQAYITHCLCGRRGAVGAMLLRQKGFDVVNLRGGIRNWPYETESAV